MAHYVDGFVIPIKKKNLKTYKKMAQLGCKYWMKYGALNYYECIAEEHSEHGLGFQKMCKLKKDETVIFAFVIFKSKSERNRINKKVMKEFESMGEHPPMPFDMNRFAMAGCKVLVSK